MHPEQYSFRDPHECSRAAFNSREEDHCSLLPLCISFPSVSVISSSHRWFSLSNDRVEVFRTVSWEIEDTWNAASFPLQSFFNRDDGYFYSFFHLSCSSFFLFYYLIILSFLVKKETCCNDQYFTIWMIVIRA